MTLLLRERRDALSLESLAVLLAALHVGPTPRTHQELITEVLLSRTGTAFHDLKYRLNSTRDHHDLEHLVFEEIDEDLRETLLEHFAEQAHVDPNSDLRVLCDIDDTVKCAIHDDRYPRARSTPGWSSCCRPSTTVPPRSPTGPATSPSSPPGRAARGGSSSATPATTCPPSGFHRTR